VGELYLVALQRITANRGDFAEIAAWARPWLEFLHARSDGAGQLPGEYLDCIPTNLVRDSAGQLHYIDAEWRANTPIPLAWVAVRGLIIAIAASPPPHALGKISYRQFACTILTQEGMSLTEDDWRALAEWEDDLRTHCYGNFRATASFTEHLARTDLPWTAYPTCHEALAQAEAEITRVKTVKTNILWKACVMLRNLLRRR
jgi:hypothetical protein